MILIMNSGFNSKTSIRQLKNFQEGNEWVIKKKYHFYCEFYHVVNDCCPIIIVIIIIIVTCILYVTVESRCSEFSNDWQMIMFAILRFHYTKDFFIYRGLLIQVLL